MARRAPDDRTSAPNHVSRREMLKKLGFFTAGALVGIGVLRRRHVQEEEEIETRMHELREPTDAKNQAIIHDWEMLGRGEYRKITKAMGYPPDYFERVRYHEQLERGVTRSGAYRPHVERIFAERGIPLELVDLAFPESTWSYRVVSRAGAQGLYQFMPRTGKEYGMDVQTRVFDERCDPILAAEGAARYLKRLFHLYEKHDDAWLWALTAYNTGMGRIRSFVERTDGDFARFHDIQKNTESRTYAAKFFGLRRAVHGPGGHASRVQPESTRSFDAINLRYKRTHDTVRVKAGDTLSQLAVRHKTTVRILEQENNVQKGRIRAGQTLRIPREQSITVSQAAESMGISVAQLLKLNPAIHPTLVRPEMALPHRFRLNLPEGKGDDFARWHAGKLHEGDATPVKLYRP